MSIRCPSLMQETYEPVLKRCGKCAVWKSLASFYKHRGRSDGLQPHCKACEHARDPRPPITHACAVCEVSEKLHASPAIRRELLCAICIEGRAMGITDPLELSVWSLLARRNQT